MNYTYLLRCADGTLYCGWTNHLAARVAAHNAGKVQNTRKPADPVVLAYYEEICDAQRGDAPGGSDQETDQKRKKEAMAALGRTELPVDDET